MAWVWDSLWQTIQSVGRRRRALTDTVLDYRAAVVLARTAHELRQPLSASSAAFALIRKADDPRIRDRACAVLDRQLTLMVQLIDDLAEASRLRLDRTVLHYEHCELNRVVTEAVEAIQPPLTAKQQTLDLRISPEPVWIHADSRRLRQVLSNLLSNGIAYTDAGGILSVGLSRASDNAIVTVSDTGRGMSSNELSHVFGLFERGDAPAGQGLGIGLAVAQRLVELHGGSIRASSRGRGQGSEFVVSLPCERPPVTLRAGPSTSRIDDRV
jgi:signal transduction histidine kinase